MSLLAELNRRNVIRTEGAPQSGFCTRAKPHVKP